MKHGRNLAVFALATTGAVLMVGAVACSQARMALPGDLQGSAQVMSCKGRMGFNENFEMGVYRVFDVKRGWTKRTAWGFFNHEKSRSSQKYEYALTGSDGAVWRGQALAKLRESDFRTEAWGGELEIGLASDQNLFIRLGREDAKSGWTMFLMKNLDNVMEGWLGNGAAEYRIKGTRRLAGTPMPLTEASGYVISRDGRSLAAVDVVNAGSVAFSRSLELKERDLLAAAAAALLLYQDLED